METLEIASDRAGPSTVAAEDVHMRPCSQIVDRCWKRSKERARLIWRYATSHRPVTYRRITKAAVTYMLCSYLVLIRPVNITLGSANYLAPIVLLFWHPARTIGSMLESLVLGLMCVAVTFGIVLLGFFFSALYVNTVDEHVIGQGPNGMTVSTGGALIMAAMGLFFTFWYAYFRAKYVRLSTSIIGAQIVLMVGYTMVPFVDHVPLNLIWGLVLPYLIGIGFSVFVNFTLWPEGASREFRIIFHHSLMDTSDTLKVITDAFLLKKDVVTGFNPANSLNVSQLQSLLNHLSTAKSDAKRELTYAMYNPVRTAKLAEKMKELGQFLAAMTASVQAEYNLMSEGVPWTSKIPHKVPKEAENSVDEAMQAMVLEFVRNIAPSIEKLSGTCQLALQSIDTSLFPDMEKHLREPWWFMSFRVSFKEILDAFLALFRRSHASAPHMDSGLSNDAEISGDSLIRLEAALEEFDKCQSAILSSLYATKSPEEAASTQGSSTDRECHDGDIRDHLNGSMNAFEGGVHSSPLTSDSDVYLPQERTHIIYFFIFNLREMVVCVKDMVVMANAIKVKSLQRGGKWKFWWPVLLRSRSRRRWYHWLRTAHGGRNPGDLRSPIAESEASNLGQSETPDSASLFGRLYKSISRLMTVLAEAVWKFGRWAQRFEVRYGLKMALAVSLVAFPAYIPTAYGWYTSVRASWALVTVVIIMRPTLGATVDTSINRIYGTLAGAVWAYVSWIIGNGNPYVLGALAVPFFFFNFYILLAPTLKISAPLPSYFGTVALLTYTAIADSAYTYNLDNDSVATPLNDIFTIAAERTLAVLSGIGVGLIVSRIVWPYVARVELRLGIADALNQFGILYSMIVTNFTIRKSRGPDTHQLSVHSQSSLLSLAPHLVYKYPFSEGAVANDHGVLASISAHQFRHFEFHLEHYLGEMKQLFSFAQREPRLQGPFRKVIYAKLLESLDLVLARFIYMRRASMEERFSEAIYDEIIAPSNAYRKELASSILLFFYILSSSLRSKTPLPPYLPPARKNHRELLRALRHLPTIERHMHEHRVAFIYYNALGLCFIEIIRELETLGWLVLQLVGENGYVKGLFAGPGQTLQ